MITFKGYYIYGMDSKETKSIDPGVTNIDIAVELATKEAKDSKETVILSFIENNRTIQHSAISEKGNVYFL